MRVRALGVDLGSKRIGIAVSSGRLATPLTVVHRCGDRVQDHRRIVELADEYEVDQIVVGLPRSLDGSVGAAAAGVLEEVAELGERVRVPVTTYDERMTTVEAEGALKARGMHGRARRRVIDASAAAVILQGWIDQSDGEVPDPGTWNGPESR